MTYKKLRGSLWDQPLQTVVQNHLIAYPTPSNLNGNYNWGVQAGLCLVLQIVTGIFQAMHYCAHVDLAFHSVQHLMRDVPNGWQLRYLHANGASLFFIVVYMHLFRGLYYTSYAQPREFVWLVGVVILLIMILTAFIGYVLPWGLDWPEMNHLVSPHSPFSPQCAFFTSRIPALKRIGPHHFDVLCFLYGAQLSDAHAEKHGNGTRITFHHTTKQISFLYSMQTFQYERGYCINEKRKIHGTIGKNGKQYYSLKFYTFPFHSLDWIHEKFYLHGKKRVPQDIQNYLSPYALAIWIMIDGSYTGYGMLLHTKNFSDEDHTILQKAQFEKYGFKTTIHTRQGKYKSIYIPRKHFRTLKKQVEPYFEKTMLYKLGK